MSQSSTSKKRDDRKTKRFWITLSLILSTAILIWSFTLPFRQPGSPLVSSAPSEEIIDHDIDLSERIKQRRTNAEEFRDAAIALDREFMRSIAEKNRPKRNLPGAKQVRQTWERQTDTLKRQIHRLKDAEEGTVEWEARQRMISRLENIEDAPE